MSAALAAALPRITEDMQRVSRLFAAGQRGAAIGQFHDLAAFAIRTQRPDITCSGYMIRGRTTEISVCRIPSLPRPDKPIALFLPGLLSALPLTAVRALALVDLFDIVICELPGHGATGELSEVSIEAFAAEYAALIDTALPRAGSLFVIGESLGGLVALGLARLRPTQVRDVLLIDTPFQLTRPDVAPWIAETWRATGRRPYVRRICREIMGFDPDGDVVRTTPCHGMVRDVASNCLLVIGGDRRSSGLASVVNDDDITALLAENPRLLVAPRVAGTGHAVLLDNPDGARATVEMFLRCRAARL